MTCRSRHRWPGRGAGLDFTHDVGHESSHCAGSCAPRPRVRRGSLSWSHGGDGLPDRWSPRVAAAAAPPTPAPEPNFAGSRAPCGTAGQVRPASRHHNQRSPRIGIRGLRWSQWTAAPVRRRYAPACYTFRRRAAVTPATPASPERSSSRDAGSGTGTCSTSKSDACESAKDGLSARSTSQVWPFVSKWK
jgi:hypothetical protein